MNNILQYESDIWSTADLLIGAGIKQSDFPKFMMPFLALIMVESRLIRKVEELKTALPDVDDLAEEIKELGFGYNDFVVRRGLKLKDLLRNDKTYDTDYDAYLTAFDSQTQSLLGVNCGNEQEKHLDISGISGQLKKKSILFQTLKAWSAIDLVTFSNPEITTLEEHIKRKWADISAETAGEQYTPDDIIALISEIITSKVEDNGTFLTIYDPTCGGGNLLFGVEDNIRATFKNRPTATFGQDWSDSLYALAKIESRFREDADIRHGNSLTDIHFIHKKFSVIVANPPYGVDWKGYKKDIEADQTERFVALPSVSDGQFLFAQHILYHLADDGLAIVVHNGSTLFSGDAGSGESNIRKHFLEKDWVEAIIQMPTDEFFNTGIYTYLWVFNKRKAPERKDKIALINASALYKPLKKSRGKKRKAMEPANRKDIVDVLTLFTDNDFCRVFPKWHFYYNRQAVMLTAVDEDGKSFESELPVKTAADGEEVRAKSVKLQPTRIEQTDEDGTFAITDFLIRDFDSAVANNLTEYYERHICPLVSRLDYKEAEMAVHTAAAAYWYDAARETLMERRGGEERALGAGRIVVKAAMKKATKTAAAAITITAELTPEYVKDYEIIPYHPDEAENAAGIAAFTARYIHKPFRLLEAVVGVEVNFNKVFYKPEVLRPVEEIAAELAGVEEELAGLEKGAGAMMKYERYKDSGVEWLGEVPDCWDVVRIKDCVQLITGFPFKSEEYSETGVKLARGINVKEGVFHWGDTKFWNRMLPFLKPYYLRAGDVLIGMDGSKVGKNYCIVREADLPVLLLQRVARLRTKEKLNPELLYFLIGSTSFQYWVAISKTDPMVPHIAPHDLHNFPVAIPAKSEQATVADFLQKKTAAIDRKLALLGAKLLRYAELSKTIINEAVCRGLDKSAPLKDSGVEWLGRIPAHWEVKRLKDIVAVNPWTDVDLGNVATVDFLPMSGVDEGAGRIRAFQSESFDVVKQGYTAFQNGDVLFAKITPCMENGNCVLVDGLRNKVGFGSTEFIVLRGRKLLNRFLYHFLRNKRFLKKAEQFMIGAAGQKRIPADYLRVHSIALPPPEEQTAIAAYLDHQTATIARISTTLKAQMAALKELRKSLINDVVTGKRRVAG